MKTMKFTTTKLVEHNGKTYIVKSLFRDWWRIFTAFNSSNKKKLIQTENMFGEIPEINLITKKELDRAIKEHQNKFELILGADFKNDDFGNIKYYETAFDANNGSEYSRHWIRTTFYEENFYKNLKEN